MLYRAYVSAVKLKVIGLAENKKKVRGVEFRACNVQCIYRSDQKGKEQFRQSEHRSLKGKKRNQFLSYSRRDKLGPEQSVLEDDIVD